MAHRKIVLRAFIGSFLLMICFCINPEIIGPVNGSDVPPQIQQNGNTYILTSDLEGGLSLYGQDKIVDGQGHTISDGSIFLTSNSEGACARMVIKNCVLQNCNIFVNYGQEIIITGNVIRNCWTNDTVAHFERGVGITIYGGGSSIIFGNTIADNQNGICITGTPSTLVYHNNFVNNTVDVTNYNVPFHSLGNATAQFDNGKEGNYWSRYAGEDANIDGIGDTPFYIGEGIQDNYPLMTSISPIVYVPSEATAIPTPTSNSSPAPLPSIPEYPAWASLPLLMLTLFIVIATKVRIQCSRPRGLRCDYLGAQETHIRAIAAALILSLRQLSYKWLSLIKLLAPTVCP